MKKSFPLLKRHLLALSYVVTVILPAIISTRKRPVIFSRWGGIGDILCTFPAVSELMKRHPDCFYIYNCAPGSKCLPRLAGLPVRVTTLSDIGLVNFWYGRLIGNFYDFKYSEEAIGVVSHEILHREFARLHGVMVGNEHPRLFNNLSTNLKVQRLLEAQGLNQLKPRQLIIVIHPGPTWAVKEWPITSWISLVEKLREQGHEMIFQLGTKIRAHLQEAFAPEIPGVISLVEKLSLEETIALISMADLFIGIDSGLLHIATCVRTPSVGLWGPTAPLLLFSEQNARFFLVSKVECVGCHYHKPRLHWLNGCPYDIRCMKAVSVEDVLSACISCLASPTKERLLNH
jgi:ADP-heptose:LPS heptosyltransferase